MPHFRYLVTAFALACAVAPLPAVAQMPVSSVPDQLMQRSLDDVVRAQQDAVIRVLVQRRIGSQEMESVPLPSPRPEAMTHSAVLNQTLHSQSRHWGHSLLAVGALALVGGFADYLSRDAARGVSAPQRIMIGSGFGLTFIGATRLDAANRAWAQAEQLRGMQFVADQ